MEERKLTEEDVTDQWKEVHDKLIRWYGIADSKSMGVITIKTEFYSAL
jgi:hypothetical protein